MGNNRSIYAPAVARALDVIEVMASGDRNVSFSEIMKKVDIPRQSLIRILNTLCERGIIEKSGQRGGYQLGMRLLYLGGRIQDKLTLRSVALPFMHELARKTQKTVELSTLDRDQLILIEQVEGSEGVRLYSRIGSAYPYLHALAVGKNHLAYMGPEKRRKVLSKIGLPSVTENTITDFAKLEKELLKVQKNGVCI